MIPNPWADLPVAPAGKLSRRRVSAESQHEILWFRDEEGHPGLLIEIDHTVLPSHLRAFSINLRDVPVSIVELADAGFKALSVQLMDDSKLDIFSRLCHDIAERVTNITDIRLIFQTACRRLRKWQDLFAARSAHLLTAGEVQGLFAELYFLDELMEGSKVSQREAIVGWKGPGGTPQDFILSDMAVEIKSLAGHQRDKVRISSEDQLHSHLSQLFLRVYILAEIRGASGGESLNSLVERISSKITEEENRQVFESTLSLSGYIDLPEYSEPEFNVKSCYTYLVSDAFPRITPKTLPAGIQAVSYDLHLTAIEPFRISNAEAVE